jgi:hypothetical protein
MLERGERPPLRGHWPACLGRYTHCTWTIRTGPGLSTYLHELRYKVWVKHKMFRERRIWKRKLGITGPSEELHAQVREWKAGNRY